LADQWLVVVLPRLLTANAQMLDIPLPDGAPGEWRDVLNGGKIRTRGGTLPAARALRAGFPLVVVPR